MKKMTKFVAAAFAATMFIPAIAFAQDVRNTDYVGDSDKDVVRGSDPTICWHTGYWTPSSPVAPCGPVAKPVAIVTPAAPAPVVVAAAPAVVPAPEPVKSISKSMSFSADALFAFNESTLKPEGRAMLDDLVRQLNGTTYEAIQATGHTDRIGSESYNYALSVRRADAVKDYLVSRDVPAARIDAEGKGKSQPITANGDCAGAKSVKVIACLQPDRRVDVEMKGVRTVTSSR